MAKLFISDIYSYSEAAKFLDNLNPASYPAAKEKYLAGGTFEIDEISKWVNTEGFSGLMFWFGLNLEYAPHYFVGVEPEYNFVYDEKQVNNYSPKNQYILVSGNPFSYQEPTNRDFENFLRTDIQSVQNQDFYIDKAEMNNFIASFFKEGFYQKFQKYSMAYFHDEIEEENQFIFKNVFKFFLNQGNVKYIRYYLGFSEEDSPQFLRLILVPVDSNGCNLNLIKDGFFVGFSEPQTLQRSWPPPPNT